MAKTQPAGLHTCSARCAAQCTVSDILSRCWNSAVHALAPSAQQGQGLRLCVELVITLRPHMKRPQTDGKERLTRQTLSIKAPCRGSKRSSWLDGQVDPLEQGSKVQLLLITVLHWSLCRSYASPGQNRWKGVGQNTKVRLAPWFLVVDEWKWNCFMFSQLRIRANHGICLAACKTLLAATQV